MKFISQPPRFSFSSFLPIKIRGKREEKIIQKPCVLVDKHTNGGEKDGGRETVVKIITK